MARYLSLRSKRQYGIGPGGPQRVAFFVGILAVPVRRHKCPLDRSVGEHFVPNGFNGITRSYIVPVDGRASTRSVVPSDWQDATIPILQIMPVGYDFFDVMEIDVIQGRQP